MTPIGPPESYWKLRELRRGVEAVSWAWKRQKPDLGDCLAERLPDRPWLLQLWEPLHTKAPSPARCQPYFCYLRTVIFYHRPYIKSGGYPWCCDGYWSWIEPAGSFVKYDEIETRLGWDDVVSFDGDTFTIEGGRVAWRYKRWWMFRSARRRQR